MNVDPLNIAAQLAPVPGEDGTREDWIRHHAATALAAYAQFHTETADLRDGAPGSRPDIGWLISLAVASTHAASLLVEGVTDETPHRLWQVTPGYGDDEAAERWVVTILDRQCGINPADIDPRYIAGDFRSPLRAGKDA